MKVKHVYRGISKSEAFEEKVKSKFEKIAKINVDLHDVTVEVSKDGPLYIVKILAVEGGKPIIVDRKAEDVHSAFDEDLEAFKGITRRIKTEFDKKRRQQSYTKRETEAVEEDEFEVYTDEFDDTTSILDDFDCEIDFEQEL